MPHSSSLKSPSPLTVGILEIQGAFLEHRAAVERAATSLGLVVDVVGVRQVCDVKQEMDGLIIPGGESTTIGLFLKRNHMLEPLQKWIKTKGKVTWGTCAGMILLAKDMENKKEDQQSVGSNLGRINLFKGGPIKTTALYFLLANALIESIALTKNVISKSKQKIRKANHYCLPAFFIL